MFMYMSLLCKVYTSIAKLMYAVINLVLQEPINHMSSTLTMVRFMNVYIPFHLLTANLEWTEESWVIEQKFLDFHFT